MAVRKIIEIDEELCDGCGDCVIACHEGAIQIVDGIAKVVNDSFCDGIGDCIGECPLGAIEIIEREAVDFDEAAVEVHLAELKQAEPAGQVLAAASGDTAPCGCPSAAMQDLGLKPATAAPAKAGGGCPGSAMQQMTPPTQAAQAPQTQVVQTGVPAPPVAEGVSQPVTPSQLGHWPVQLALIPPHAPFLKDQDLLICADCVPFTVPDFHFRYLTGRAVVVGCPKLDNLEEYFVKLKAMFVTSTPKSITVLKMEVPCCNGIAQAAVQAQKEVAPHIPLHVETIGVRGGIIERKTPCQS